MTHSTDLFLINGLVYFHYFSFQPEWIVSSINISQQYKKVLILK
jgi:hypothetical protein